MIYSFDGDGRTVFSSTFSFPAIHAVRSRQNDSNFRIQEQAFEASKMYKGLSWCCVLATDSFIVKLDIQKLFVCFTVKE